VLEEVTTMEQVEEYYEMAKYTYTLRGGRLPYPFQFYRYLFEIMLNKNLIKWHLARKDGKPIAGTLHFVYKDMVFDLLDTSYREYQNLRANDLLVYNMIKWSCENSFKYYNFGSSGGDEKLMRFKEIWGGERSYFPMYEKRMLLYKIVRGTLNMIRKVQA
jgi:lipid II:glycine glycyltransferase (peptidoglycan interpeptide bridge formation enzyme)